MLGVKLVFKSPNPFEIAMAGDEKLISLLESNGLFGRLSANELRECAASFREVRFSRGQIIFSRGSEGSSLYLVAEGRVRLAVTTSEGRELSVRHAVAGDLLGEIAMLDGGTRSADAVSLTEVLAYSLSRAAFDRLAGAYPGLGQAVVAFLCRRLRDTTDQLEAIALYPIEVRLARFLLVALGGRVAPAGKRVPLDLEFSQSELAQLLAASRPKVNVALGVLETEGAIRRTADRLFCDPTVLARIAEPLAG
jgi:CRP/FNR family cyclic AMP-dependent transcriptional regulator